MFPTWCSGSWGRSARHAHRRGIGADTHRPASISSAFRIVQEALTNILKHAGPASSTVTIRYEERRILLTIDDDGAGTQRRPDDNRLRFGHLGMQERVALFGGWLRTGSSPSGGYRVDACLPLDDDLP